MPLPDALHQPEDVVTLEPADSRKSWHLAEAVETTDSSGTALTAQDYTCIEHTDVEYIASWLSEQVETVKDPSRVLQLLEDKVLWG